MLQLGPNFPAENKNSKFVSDNANPSCNVMTGNFKNPCTNFRFGHCRYGSNCFFAHGTGEMMPNLQLGRVWNGVYGLGNQSNVCKMFYFRKECAYGDKCKFLHENPEKTVKSSSVSRGFSRPLMKKYRLCKKWEITGSCSYGKMCCFAHGLAELERPSEQIELASWFLPAKTVETLALEKDVIRTSFKRKLEELECKFQQKEVRKASGIYADWIDDMPFLHNSLNKEE
ncbi:zinc finger CCCH domain-containing protein 39-like [Mercurialis annua]|uniref:zinc finger CCCH domain-containing protein 39-like n=1 Tax=Mercurialis annua TaxID=3986 RepID=UPI00215FCE0C|nr:zinc finger CCCH domain-containing protein 39-like [Mercurialis annua]